MRITNLAGAAFLALLSMTSSACDSGKVVKEAEALADKACACSDPACAKQMLDEYRAFWEQNRGAKVRKSDNTRLAESFTRTSKCLFEHGVTPADLKQAIDVEAP